MLFLLAPRVIVIHGQVPTVQVQEIAVAPIRIYKESDVEVIEYIIAVFGKESDNAIKVFRCESRFRAGVISKTNDIGVSQINLKAHWEAIEGETREEKIQALQDYRYNIDFAHSLFKKSGWVPWKYSKKCWDK